MSLPLFVPFCENGPYTVASDDLPGCLCQEGTGETEVLARYTVASDDLPGCLCQEGTGETLSQETPWIEMEILVLSRLCQRAERRGRMQFHKTQFNL